MNKSEFLKRLAALLHILQEDEVKDILDEYEQHIDMKMEGGMSEHDAIRDFGSVEELAAEILSAYHVRTDFESKKENKVLEKMQGGSKKVLNRTGSAVKNAGTKTGSFIKRGLEKCKKILVSPFIFLKNLWSDRKNKKVQKQKRGAEDAMTITGAAKGIGTGCVHFCQRCVDWLIRICFGCIFLCAGFMELGLVLCAGLLLVLMILGYPVIGITLAVIGSAMSMFVIVYYSGKKMRGRA